MYRSVEIEDTLPPSSAHGPTRPLQVVVFCPSTGPLQFSSHAKVSPRTVPFSSSPVTAF